MRTDPPAAALRICAKIRPRTVQAKPQTSAPATVYKPGDVSGGRSGSPSKTAVERNAANIKRLLLSGLSTRKIAIQLHLSRTAVQKHARKLGLARSKRSRQGNGLTVAG